MFLNTVDKISECFFTEGDTSHRFRESAKCAEFILAVVSKMQPIYKYGILSLIFYFNVTALVYCWKNFANLSLDNRTKMVNRWAKSTFGPKRDLMKLLLNLAVIAYYDSESVLKKNGINTSEYLKIQRLYNG